MSCPAHSSPPTLRILCVDDNEMMISAMERRVQHEPGLAWVGAVSDGAVALEAVRSARPDVVLMDIDMPGVDTFALVERLAEELPAVRVVMFSGHVRPGFIDRALDCGAWGYLSKSDDTANLIEGIRRVGKGEIALSREVLAVQRRAAM